MSARILINSARRLTSGIWFNTSERSLVDCCCRDGNFAALTEIEIAAGSMDVILHSKQFIVNVAGKREERLG